MKGVMYPALAVFALVVSIFIVVFLVPRAVGPSMATYGIKEAGLVAKSLSTSINALGVMEEGSIEKIHPGAGSWNVVIKGDDVIVSHGEFQATEKLLVRVEETSLVDTRKVFIEKLGNRITVSKRTVLEEA